MTSPYNATSDQPDHVHSGTLGAWSSRPLWAWGSDANRVVVARGTAEFGVRTKVWIYGKVVRRPVIGVHDG